MPLLNKASVVTTISFLCLIAVSPIFGQASGNIVGSVVDPSGAIVAGATVKVSNKQSGVERTVTTNDSGTYRITALLPGDYNVATEMVGFKPSLKQTTVTVGRDITVDFALEVGSANQSVTVQAEAVAVNLTDSKVDDIITPSDVTALPLNGRNAYEMAKLVPAVQVSTSGPTRNRDVQISIAGLPAANTRITIDGLSQSDMFTGGGTDINLSQEDVQEFQVSISNGDASMGATSSGAVNMVTRSGGNQYHGSVYGYFRNNQYAAYPGLARFVPTPNPTNDPDIAAYDAQGADPGFHRYQYGGIASGPIIKDKLFWLVSIENSPSLILTPFNAGSPDLNAFNELKPNNVDRFQENFRADWHVTQKQSLFWRFTWDRIKGRILGSGIPSSDTDRLDRNYSAMMGWTWVLSPSLVSDLRFGFTRLQDDENPAIEANQEASLYASYLPAGTPIGNVSVSGTSMSFGAFSSGRVINTQPRAELVENVTYVHGKNTWKFGIDIDRSIFTILWNLDYPWLATVYSPATARAAGISVPATFTTVGDLMQLPVANVSVGIGPAQYPDNWFEPDNIRVKHHYHFYGGSSYRAKSNLTLNWSLGYSYADHDWNWDLPKPKSLSAVFNGELYPTHPEKHDFAPLLGFVWDPKGKGHTVIRGGFGIYYGTVGQTALERPMLAPVGDGRVIVDGSFITNPLSGKGTLVFPTAAANKAAGVVTMAEIGPYIQTIRQNLESTLFTGNNTNLSVTNLDYFKGTSSRNIVISPNARYPFSIQNMLGFEQTFGNNWAVSVSGIYDITTHTSFTYDGNRQFRVGSCCPVVYNPINPNLNAVTVMAFEGRTLYKGLLVTVNKKLSNRYQLAATYTLSSTLSQANPFNLNNFSATYGPDPNDRRHILNLDGTMQLPLGLQLSLINTIQSRLPFNVYVGTTSNVDLYGDGGTNNLLPGVPYDGVNRGVSIDQLRQAVTAFNQKYAGTKDARGDTIPTVNLPANFTTGDSLIDQDVRLSKTFRIKERFSTIFSVEAFNVFNIANLNYTTTAGNLLAGTSFGQPSSRLTSTTGSGGPRALQFIGRFSF